MKKIVSLDLKSIHVGENLEFLRKICEKGDECLPTEGTLEAADLPEATTTLLTAAYNKANAATRNFDTIYKVNPNVAASVVATEADLARDKAYRDSYRLAKAMTYHPTPSVAEVAKVVTALFDNFGDPTSLSQNNESAAINSLLQDLEDLDEGVLETIHFTEWFQHLKARQAAFLEADKRRTAEKQGKETGATRTAQNVANQAYKDFVEAVNALVLVNGEAPYAEFIDFVNAQIKELKTVAKKRATINAKKREEEDDETVGGETEKTE